MANEQNLVQNRSREEAEALSRKGGVASGRVRRQKRDLRESMRKILELDISPKQKEQLESLGINSEGWSLGDVVNIMAVQTAMKGNVSAMAYCRDTAGFNPELQLREAQFEYEKKQKSGEGVEIEDVSDIVEKIWGYDQWISMLNDGVPVLLTKQVPYRFSDIHLDYIRKCQDNTYNILEGAVRSGKTVDHVLAFAKELCDTPDKFHLATGSTMANAKLNIGDANGFGLEHIFRGQCRWTSYKDNDALAIRGPYTNFKEKIVIFAGGGSSASYQKIRGNSYGMWIATSNAKSQEIALQKVVDSAKQVNSDIQASVAAANSAASSANQAASTANTEAGKAASATKAANDAESIRSQAETARKNAETERVSAETARVKAETARNQAEMTRASNETTRSQNEATRIQNEKDRQTNTAAAIAKAKEATDLLVNQANTIAFRINSEDGGLDAVILTA